MRYFNDPDGRRLPIKLDATTNGEFAPIPLEPVHRHANTLAFEAAGGNARRLNLSRRAFLASACGAASTLLAMNAGYAAAGRRGGYYELASESALEMQVARSALDKSEFVFDVQGHFVNPTGAWTRALPPGAQPLKDFTVLKGCSAENAPGLGYLQCLGSDAFVKDIFLDSDTDLVVLSFVPSTRKGEPLTIEEAAATARIVERMEGTHRVLLHGRVNPNQDGDLEGMDELAARYPIAAWKTYTQWGSDGRGFFLDDDVGLAMIDKARKLGVRTIAVHKGLPFGSRSYQHSTCVDIGRVAKRCPDVKFLVYHSGFVPGRAEGPYDPQRAEGIDALVTSLRENGIPPGGERLRRARLHLAVSHARSRRGRARAGQAFQVRRRRQRTLGNRFDLVRFAAGSDPGFSHVPDRGRARGEARLPEDHARAARQGFRTQRARGLLDSSGRIEKAPCRRPRCP